MPTNANGSDSMKSKAGNRTHSAPPTSKRLTSPSKKSSSSHTQKKRRKTPKIGCNDPCPCGSGKKYKHCYGRNK